MEAQRADGGASASTSAPRGAEPCSHKRAQAAKLIEMAKVHAFKRKDQAYQPPAKRQLAEKNLLPVFVDVPRETSDIREEFLWRFGEPGWDPKGVSYRLTQELGLTHIYKAQFDEAVDKGLRGLAGWKDAGKEVLVRLQIYVRRGSAVLRDEVEWDVASPTASPHQYASEVCRHLALDLEWYCAVQAHVAGMVAELAEDARRCPGELEVLPPPPSVKRNAKEWQPQPPAAGAGAGAGAGAKEEELAPLAAHAYDGPFPRIEPYDPATDIEAHRLAKRRARQQTQAGPTIKQE